MKENSMQQKIKYQMILSVLIVVNPLVSLAKEKSTKLNEQQKIRKELKDKTQKLELEKKLAQLIFEKTLEKNKQRLQKLELQEQVKSKEDLIIYREYEKTLRENEFIIKKFDQNHRLKTQKMRKAIDELSLENQNLTEINKKQSQIFAQEQLKNKIEREKLVAIRAQYEHKLDELDNKINYRKKMVQWEQQTNQEIKYEQNPFQNEILYVTDRRIEIKGSIVYGTADYVTERIHYFNNKSHDYPIFIVVGRSPGGSVMEGYRIIKAMEASKAPIHVVIKSYAASMTAVIATLADHSYAYKNAILLHHQPTSFRYGNLTEQQQGVEIFKEWAHRLHTPVALKMGITLDAFYQEMYNKDANGDWQEFADNAVKLKWIDHIVERIEEHGITESPDTDSYKKRKKGTKNIAIQNQVGEDGEVFMKLPKLEAFDFYFLHNNNKYRW